MNNLEFEQRLNDAFENNLPIADKVNQLRLDLDDTKSNQELMEGFWDNSLFSDIEQANSYDNFYQLCQLHFKVADSAEFDNVATTPIKNTDLWSDSVIWLAVYLDFIMHLDRNHDKKFGAFINSSILWRLKWVLNHIVENPYKDFSEIYSCSSMLHYYYDLYGLGERSIHKIRVMQGIKMANKEIIEENLQKWLEAPTNDFDDCLACQYDDIIRAYCFLKQYDKALEWAKEILDGSVTCGEVPHATNSLIAEAYFYTNQADKAVAILEKGYPLIQGKMEFLRPISEFIRLYREMNMMDKAVAIFEENKHLLENCESPYEKMLFLIETVKLPIDNKKTYTLEAMSLATQFDLRNGNAYYLSQLPKVIS